MSTTDAINQAIRAQLIQRLYDVGYSEGDLRLQSGMVDDMMPAFVDSLIAQELVLRDAADRNHHGGLTLPYKDAWQRIWHHHRKKLEQYQAVRALYPEQDT
jgi:hypothetical protein